MKHVILPLAALALAGPAACASPENEAPFPFNGLPFNAEIGENGFATILSAPPASFDPVEPPPPAPRTAAQNAADADFMRVAEYQNSVSDEVQALAERLRREERGNFQTLHYDNEGELGVVFEFLRDGPATLRKYSKNPSFRGETVRWSQEELMAAAEFMRDTFREDRVIQSTGTGTQVTTVEISVSEGEFRALVKRKGVTIPEPVKLIFSESCRGSTRHARLRRIGPYRRTSRPICAYSPGMTARQARSMPSTAA